MFEPGSLAYRAALVVSTIALGLGALSQAKSGVDSLNTGSYLMGTIMLILAVLLGFGAFFNGGLLVKDLK
jgi:hypothetical protein